MRIHALACALVAGLLGSSVAAEETANDKLLTFDGRRAELRWQGNQWQLVVGGTVLKDFGRRDAEGRLALRLVRDLNLTQYGTVGAPQPVMEFWLANGRAPVGPATGLRTTPLDQQSLHVEESQKQWLLRDSRRVLFNFGSREEDARQAEAVIRRYHFSQVGYIGSGTPSMIVFLAEPGREDLAQLPSSHAPRLPGQPQSGSVLTSHGHFQGEATGDPVMAPPHSPKTDDQRMPSDGLNGKRSTDTPPVVPQGRQLAMPPITLAETQFLTERFTFDWRQLQVGRDGGNWKLTAGPQVVANFGRDEPAARQALATLQFYRCSEQHFIGQPKPTFSYFLTGTGQPPHGQMLGMNALPFHATDLSVKQVNKEWVITDGSRTLFRFGDKEDNAKQALQAIQQHRFDHLATIGRGETPAMSFLYKAF